MSQAYYRKWRPQTWDDVIGQEHITHTLLNAIQGDRIVHAYLFAGPRGTGKTSTARLLAKAVNCLDENPAQRPCNQCLCCLAVNRGNFLDLIEIDAASNTSVDDVRDLRDKINFLPSLGKYKIYIIDEVHMLSTAAFNALLKTLEEPPKHAIFILATTEIHKLPATVLSRCQRHEFRRISVNSISAQLRHMVEIEKIDSDEESLTLIARQATGSMRDAISLLDQLASTGKRITIPLVQEVIGIAPNQAVSQLMDAILSRQTAAGLQVITRTLDSGTDPRQFARQIVEYLRSLLLIRMGNSSQVDATNEMRAQMDGHARQFTTSLLLDTLQRFNNLASEPRGTWHPGLSLELALAEIIEGQAAPSESDSDPGDILKPSGKQEIATDKASSPVERKAKPPEIKPEKPLQTAPIPDKAKSSPAINPSAVTDQHAAPLMEDGSDLNLHSIRSIWEEVRRQVRNQRPPTEALLNSCKSISFVNGELILGFASEVVKSKMESKENISLTGQIISNLLGRTVSIRCLVVSKKVMGTARESDIDGDGMVNAAMNLGGQIIQKD